MLQTVNTLANGLTAGQFAAKIFSHAIAGGIMSNLGGGTFGDGFLAAGVTQALSMKIDQIGGGARGFSWARTGVAAFVGGTTSALSGGKFANGALTAAFSRAFNDENHKNEYSPGTFTEAFDERAAEFFSGISQHADNAVDYWVNKGGVVGAIGGTAAGVMSSNNVGNTNRQVSLGALTGGAGRGLVWLCQTHKGVHIFYSGKGMGSLAAKGEMLGKGGTIFTTRIGQFLSRSNQDYVGTQFMWKAASALIAANTKIAKVYLNNPRVRSVWLKIEKPILDFARVHVEQMK